MSEGDERSIPTELIRLALPVIGLNLFTVLTVAVDSAMCGRLDNAETALTALGFATQVVFLLLVAMMGLTVGTTSLIARAYGANDLGRVDVLMRQSTTLTLAASVTVAIVGNLLAEPILLALGASDPVRLEALAYLRPLLTTSVFYYFGLLYAGALRGLGNTRTPFAIAIVTNLVNVFLNYGLILGNMGFPALGVTGAAYGTICSYALGVGIYVVVLSRGTGGTKLSIAPALPVRRVVRDLLNVGGPAALDFVILNIAFLAIVGMLGWIEELAVAAHGIGLRVQALAFVPGLSIAQATAAMVGQALGRGSVVDAKKVTWASVGLSTAVMSTLSVTILVFAYPIVGIFDVRPDSRLEELAVMWIQQLGYCMPLVGVYIAFVGMLQGSGSTWTSLSINALTTLCFQIPLSTLLAFVFDSGPFGVWVGFPLGFVVKAALGYYVFRRERWARVGLT